MTKKNIVILISIVCLAVLVFVLMLSSSFSIARAEDLTTTYVLEDLQKDESFNYVNYPADSSDNSVTLFQIAESDTRELYVYIYQPNYANDKLRPHSIAISTSDDINNPSYSTYTLTYVNSYETLFKYRVDALTVKDTSKRYYNISQMWRKWINGIDPSTPNDNETTSIYIKVAQIWGVQSVNDEVQYECKETDIVEITSFYVDHIRYSNGFKLYVDACDAYYIAFSTDWNIDELYEVDVEYYYQNYSETSFREFSGITTNREYVTETPIKAITTVTSEDYGTNQADGLFAKKYTWQCIQSSNVFLSDEDVEFTDTAKTEVAKQQWVVHFVQFDYSLWNNSGMSWGEDATEVTNTTILRLKFLSNGRVYNLGTLSNRQSPDDIPGNTNTAETAIDDFIDKIENFFEELWDKAKAFVLTVAIIIGALLLIVVVSWIVRFISWVIRSVGKTKNKVQASKSQKKKTKRKK